MVGLGSRHFHMSLSCNLDTFGEYMEQCCNASVVSPTFPISPIALPFANETAKAPPSHAQDTSTRMPPYAPKFLSLFELLMSLAPATILPSNPQASRSTGATIVATR